MFCKRPIAAVTIFAVLTALFHVAFEHAGDEMSKPCAAAKSISDHSREHDALPDEFISDHPHEHSDGGNCADDHAHGDGHDIADHASFEASIRRFNNPAHGLVLVLQIACLPLSEHQSVEVSCLSDTLPQRFRFSPPLFSQNCSLLL